jgi:hypothetical protein
MMIKVRMRDLALVAVAGGLLAFELVSIGEALPFVKKALADRGLSGKAFVASAGAAAAPAPALEAASSTVSQAVVGAVTGHTHRFAAVTRATTSKRCLKVTRTRSGERARGRVQVVSVNAEVTCPADKIALSAERLREVEKAVDLALKQATL